MNSKLFIIAALIVGVAVTGLVSTIGPQLAKAQITQDETQSNNQQQSSSTTQTNTGTSGKNCAKNGVVVPCRTR